MSVAVDAGAGTGTHVGVPQTCGQALEARSYIGCDYWPTVTLNSVLREEFQFAVVAVNPTKSDAVITVTRGQEQIAEKTLAPGELTSIESFRGWRSSGEPSPCPDRRTGVAA